MTTARVYRSVRVVLQNSTDEPFAVQGVATLRGQWADKLTPKQADVVPKQSAAIWMNESTQLGSGASAFVRLGSSHGHVRLSWTLPWVGAFHFEDDGPNGVRREVTIDDRLPDTVVVSVVLREARRDHADEAGRRHGATR
ncbi:hypothetical protein WME79_17100 [Sorangium sp. So ce726]|uniref:hypothetical protein n=1 Tax=Sorangium sp. So ce726 TaxID=3133319 RepID=UPI003F645273